MRPHLLRALLLTLPLGAGCSPGDPPASGVAQSEESPGGADYFIGFARVNESP